VIDIFTKQRFEAALPVHNVTGAVLWKHLGMIQGEHCYSIEVLPGVLIHIRSSMGANGRARNSGEDSIRCWLAADETGTPLGSKMSRWVTRVPGWEERLTAQLRTFWTIGRKLKPCPVCGKTPRALLVKKEGPNKGRWFTDCCSRFQWLTNPKEEKPDAA